MVKCYSQSSNYIITQIDDDKLPKNFDSWEWIVGWYKVIRSNSASMTSCQRTLIQSGNCMLIWYLMYFTHFQFYNSLKFKTEKWLTSFESMNKIFIADNPIMVRIVYRYHTLKVKNWE